LAAKTGPDGQRAAASEDVDRLPPELVFRSIRSRNLFEETVARLGQAIKLGVVPYGERFPTERELAEQLQVSRVTVREALRALEQAGFVEIRRGRHGGAYVLRSDTGQSKQRARKLIREMGPKLEDAIDFRHAIEPEIAELAAQRRDEEQLARATELLVESEQVPGPGFRGADSRFHLALAAMANSPSLAAAATEVQLRFSEILSAMPILDESIRHSHAQHRKILDQIEAGDGEGARATMLEHIDATVTLLTSLGRA
jgi:GntR family transcriptional regulator, transcriptional repressor for pyruvate dehydrogenase complex